MPTIIKPDSLEYSEDPKALPQFRLKTLTPRLGEFCGSKHMMFDIRRLDPGKYSFPYHFHRNAEELMMILSGSFTLRAQDGLKVIGQGELVFFETGETGLHQFYNHTTTPCIYLDIRTTLGMDVTEYPDSGKIGIYPFREIFESENLVNYFKGEEQVGDIWKELMKD